VEIKMGKQWLLITWTTHGSWLPGDPRGFRTRGRRLNIPPPARYANTDEEAYDAKNWERLFEYHKHISKGAICLDRQQRDFINRRIAGLAAECGVEAEAIHVGSNHVHVLVECGNLEVAKFVKRLKGVTSRELSEHGLKGNVWARRYHVRRIPDEGLKGVIRYLRGH
jgi:REP element-mobilizing transposase RayT